MKTKMFAFAAIALALFSCSKEKEISNSVEPLKKDVEVGPIYFINSHNVIGCENNGLEFDPNGGGSAMTGRTWTIELDMNAGSGLTTTADYVCYYRPSGSTGSWNRSEPAVSGFNPLVFNLTAMVGRPWNIGSQDGIMYDWSDVDCLEFVVVHWPSMKSDGPAGTWYTNFDDLPLFLSNIGVDNDSQEFIRFEGVYYYDTPQPLELRHPNKGEACCTF